MVQHADPLLVREDAFFELIPADFPAKLKSIHLPKFLKYWRSIAGDDVPAREAIEPTAIKSLLPNIMLVDLTDEPLRVMYRLVGTEVVRFSGMDFTGRWLDELEFDEFDLNELHNAYRQIRDSRVPGAGRALAFHSERLMIETEYLICPLRTADGKINKCIAVEDYFLGGALSLNELPPARLRAH